MGRSKNKCFSMLTCAGAGGGGGDVAADPANAASDDTTDCHCEESKSLSDKSRWSFRRRSTRHRVLKNNEPVTNKENPNPDPITENNNNSNNHFTSPKYSTSTEKSVLEQEKPKENNNDIIVDNNNNLEGVKENIKEIGEKIEENYLVINEAEEKLEINLDQIENLKGDLEEKENLEINLDQIENLKGDLEEKENLETNLDQNENLKGDLEEKDLEINLDQIELTEQNENKILEPAALVIQSSFRGYMARRELMKIKKVVKIQALVRGYLIRNKMVGTLRCLLAIIKMQSMVRSHQVKGGSKTCASNENILLNGFASKIMDTMPKTKAFHIKCDPYKNNSTWEWFERWTYNITSIQNDIFEKPNDILDPFGDEIKIQNSNSKFESNIQIQKPDSEEKTEEILKRDIVQEDSISDSKIETEKLKSENFETKLEENEANKLGLKKQTNPAFAAAQMKFKELSSTPNSNSNLNSNSYTFPSPKNNNTPNQENENENKKIKNNNIYNITGGNLLKATSECGTEISISSTLDSPDRSETGEIILEIRNLEIKNYQNAPAETPIPESPNPNSENNSTKIEKEKEKEETSLQTTTTITTELNLTPSSQASVNTNKKNSKTKKEKKTHHNSKKPSVKRSLNTATITASQTQSGDAEPRMSNSSLPSYMQATLSARAKACSGSLGSGKNMSPDLNKNNNGGENVNGNSIERKIIKRNSLPNGGNNNIIINNNNNNNNKEVSPRMQRSQSHESEKKESGTHLHGSSDKRWQI